MLNRKRLQSCTGAVFSADLWAAFGPMPVIDIFAAIRKLHMPIFNDFIAFMHLLPAHALNRSTLTKNDSKTLPVTSNPSPYLLT